MNSHSDRQREILKQLSRLVEELAQESSDVSFQGSELESPSCVLLSLPDQLQVAQLRRRLNTIP